MMARGLSKDGEVIMMIKLSDGGNDAHTGTHPRDSCPSVHCQCNTDHTQQNPQFKKNKLCHQVMFIYTNNLFFEPILLCLSVRLLEHIKKEEKETKRRNGRERRGEDGLRRAPSARTRTHTSIETGYG